MESHPPVVVRAALKISNASGLSRDVQKTQEPPKIPSALGPSAFRRGSDPGPAPGAGCVRVPTRPRLRGSERLRAEDRAIRSAALTQTGHRRSQKAAKATHVLASTSSCRCAAAKSRRSSVKACRLQIRNRAAQSSQQRLRAPSEVLAWQWAGSGRAG